MLGLNFFGQAVGPRVAQGSDKNQIKMCPCIHRSKTKQRRCGIQLKCLPFFFTFEERVVPTACGRKRFRAILCVVVNVTSRPLALYSVLDPFGLSLYWQDLTFFGIVPEVQLNGRIERTILRYEDVRLRVNKKLCARWKCADAKRVDFTSCATKWSCFASL